MSSKKVRGLFRLLRFELPFTAGVCVILGELLATGALPTVKEMVLGFLSVFFLSATSLILNDYFDIESDRINAPERPLPAGLVTPRDVIFFFSIVTLLGFLTSSMLGIAAFLAGTLAWTVGFLYNWRGKKTGLAGNLMVSFSVGMTFIFGGIAAGRPLEKEVWFFGILALLINLGEEIAADAMDVAGDRHAGSHSLAVQLGGENALKISAAIFTSACALSLLPWVFGWMEWVYGIPILLMDAAILYSTLKLLDPKTAHRRLVIRWIYLSALAAILAFIFLRMVR
jgi:geranylgeranylglycerol-phosphate geranylgeranyltransferase